MKKTRRFPIFYTIYALLVIVSLILIHVALGKVTEYLADYEAAQPQYEAERVFNDYYGGDFSSLVALCETTLTPYENTGAVIQYLADFTEGKEITYSAITTGLDTSVRYIVKADDIKFSSFTLRESDEKSPLGFTLYKASEFEIYCVGTESVRITAPKGYTVSVNGVALDDTALTGSVTEDKSCDYMPEGVEGIVFLEYKVDGLYFPPESVTVTAPDGRTCEVENTAENEYSATFLYDDTAKDEHSAYVLEAAQAIAKYMQNDAKFYTPSVYIDPESELYENVRTSQTIWAIGHVSYSFEDAAVTEFYMYDENTFSCRVSFTHVLKYSQYSSLEDYRDYIDTTYFFRRVGDKFLMYDRYNH